MGFLDRLIGKGKAKPKPYAQERPKVNQPSAKPAPSEEVAELIAALDDEDAQVRLKAAIELYHHPGEATIAALTKVLKDNDLEVRGCAAESLRLLGDRRAVEPLLEMLKTEPEDSRAYCFIIGALRELGAGVTAERVIEQQRKAEISATGGPKAGKIRQMEEVGNKLSGTGSNFESAFESLFADMYDSDRDVRAEASQLLADNPSATKKLILIYQDCLKSDPRKSVLAGRVLGRKISAGKHGNGVGHWPSP